MSYDLIKSTDEHMTRSRLYLPRGTHYYPSEASVVWTDQHDIVRVGGQCLRQSWYRLCADIEGSKHDAFTQWIFALGSAVEQILVEQWKQMGVWVANNIKFYDQERNISGELDVVLSEPDGTLFGVEVKSFYGYHGTKKIIGNKSTIGRPKTSQLLQCLVYVDLCRKLELADYFKLVYYARDSAARREFNIRLIEDGEFLRPTINDVIDYRFTMQDIYDRYTELDEYVKSKVVPPRDFEKVWSPGKVEKRRSLGEVAKTTYEKWQKKPANNPIGDWQCRYCAYSEFCENEDAST